MDAKMKRKSLFDDVPWLLLSGYLAGLLAVGRWAASDVDRKTMQFLLLILFMILLWVNQPQSE